MLLKYKVYFFYISFIQPKFFLKKISVKKNKKVLNIELIKNSFFNILHLINRIQNDYLLLIFILNIFIYYIL